MAYQPSNTNNSNGNRRQQSGEPVGQHHQFPTTTDRTEASRNAFYAGVYKHELTRTTGSSSYNDRFRVDHPGLARAAFYAGVYKYHNKPPDDVVSRSGSRHNRSEATENVVDGNPYDMNQRFYSQSQDQYSHTDGVMNHNLRPQMITPHSRDHGSEPRSHMQPMYDSGAGNDFHLNPYSGPPIANNVNYRKYNSDEYNAFNDSNDRNSYNRFRYDTNNFYPPGSPVPESEVYNLNSYGPSRPRERYEPNMYTMDNGDYGGSTFPNELSTYEGNGFNFNKYPSNDYFGYSSNGRNANYPVAEYNESNRDSSFKTLSSNDVNSNRRQPHKIYEEDISNYYNSKSGTRDDYGTNFARDGSSSSYSSPQQGNSKQIGSVVLNYEEKQNFEYVNRERRKHGLPELLWSEDLTREAQRWSTYLAKIGALRHRKSLSQNIDVGWKCITENVAYNPSAGYDGAHASFMNNSDHRKNILDPKVNFLGVGVTKMWYPGSNKFGSGELFYVTHIFKQV